MHKAKMLVRVSGEWDGVRFAGQALAEMERASVAATAECVVLFLPRFLLDSFESTAMDPTPCFLSTLAPRFACIHAHYPPSFSPRS